MRRLQMTYLSQCLSLMPVEVRVQRGISSLGGNAHGAHRSNLSIAPAISLLGAATEKTGREMLSLPGIVLRQTRRQLCRILSWPLAQVSMRTGLQIRTAT